MWDLSTAKIWILESIKFAIMGEWKFDYAKVAWLQHEDEENDTQGGIQVEFTIQVAWISGFSRLKNPKISDFINEIFQKLIDMGIENFHWVEKQDFHRSISIQKVDNLRIQKKEKWIIKK